MRHALLIRPLFILCFATFLHDAIGQVAQALPQNILRPVNAQTITVQLGGDIPDGDFIFANYGWFVNPATGVTISHPDITQTAATATFTSAASGMYTFTLAKGSSTASVNVFVGNLAACSDNGQAVSVFNVQNGNLAGNTAPAILFDPFTDATSTAALGVSLNGYYYYMPNVINTGNVTLYAASPDGRTTALVATADLNGASPNNLGFVRLAIDGNGKGWMLAGDGINVYLARFTANGLNPASIEIIDDAVTINGSSAAVFQNGDLCFSGSGALFALANNGSGVTQIFTGTPNGSSTVLTKKWDLIDEAGNNFNGNVNGVAFDILGSLYISTGGVTGGLYYINQNTVNTATGTVQCSLVWSGTGLTDLASAYFPAQTSLPVTLLNFSGSFRSGRAKLGWQTENETGFDHFELERKTVDGNFAPVATLAATNTSGRHSYNYTDDLTAISGSRFIYRLRMVDQDGHFKYSQSILLMKAEDQGSILAVYPNPVRSGQATLRVYSPVTGTAEIKLLNAEGRMQYHWLRSLAEGSNSILLDRLPVIPGTYLLQATIAGQWTATTRFVVAK